MGISGPLLQMKNSEAQVVGDSQNEEFDNSMKYGFRITTLTSLLCSKRKAPCLERTCHAQKEINELYF